LGAVWIALLISWIDVCRIPVASVIAPMYKDDTPRNSKNSAPCCVPQWTLKAIEDKFPMVSGWCYGFYVFFGILFGMVTGSATGTAC
jgi:hypothetical protein